MSHTIVKLPIIETLSISWQKVYGAKLTFVCAFIVTLLFSFATYFIEKELRVYSVNWSALLGLIFFVVRRLLEVGLMYLGIERAKGNTVYFRMLFYPFQLKIAANIICYFILRALALIPSVIIMIAAVIGGFVAFKYKVYLWLVIAILICIAGFCSLVYLTYRMLFGEAFVLDKKVIFMEAFINSFKITRCNFWRLLGLAALEFLLMFACVFTLGIALIWVLPLLLIAFGTAYKTLSANI